ncbi:MAG: T9SS type A sorting domain-containing protein [bacterium]|nr:T9SS type A sorting domain-containing protein [bacterium]
MSCFAQDSLNISLIGQLNVGWNQADDLVIHNELALVATGRTGVRIARLAESGEMTEIAELSVPAFARSMCVYGEYTYVSDIEAGLLIYDTSVPESPVLAGSVPWTGYSAEVRIVNGYLYAAKGDSGMVVYSLSSPTTPVAVTNVHESDAGYYRLTQHDTLLIVGTNRGLEVFDVREPAEPVFLGQYQAAHNEYIGALDVVGTLAYCATEMNLRVLDLTNPALPADLGTIDMSFPSAVAVEGEFLYTCDRSGRLITYHRDSSTVLTALDTVVTYASGGSAKLVQRGGELFAIWQSAMLARISLSTPGNPVVTDLLDEGHDLSSVLIHNENLIAAGSYIDVFDVANPSAPFLRGSANVIGFRNSSVAYGEYLFVTSSFDSLDIYRIENNGAVEHVGSYGEHEEEDFGKLWMLDNYLYSQSNFSSDGIRVLNVSDPLNIVRVDTPNLSSSGQSPVVYNEYLYVSNFDTIEVVDVSDPSNPTTISAFPRGVRGLEMALNRNYLYVEDIFTDSCAVFDLSDPTEPALMGFIDGFDDFGISHDDYMFVVDRGNELTVYNLQNPLYPGIAGYYKMDDNLIRGLSVDWPYVYAGGNENLHIFDVSNVLPAHTRSEIPTGITLSAYPNPFNPSTTIAFDLNARAQVSLDVYDVTGRLVRTLINEQLNAGSYTHNFDAQGLPSGAYFARLVTPQVSQTARITLIR